MSKRRLFLASAALCSAVAFAVPKHQREFDYVFDRTPDLARGQQLYQTCAACHGVNGGGAKDGSVPAIAGQHFNVLAKQIVDFRHNGRLDVRMQHFADDMHLALSQQIADVSAYISGMKPVAGPDTVGNIDSGRALYDSLCTRCHGTQGEGKNDWLVPRVAGQHYEYLIRQLQDTVADGRPNMSKEHTELLKRLDERSITAIARYMTSLQP